MELKIWLGVVTLFPDMFSSVKDYGVLSKAVDRRFIEFEFYNPRDFAEDNYRRVDDYSYGGGPGMVLKFETLAQDFQWVQELIGVQEPLETLNTTSTDNDHTTSANRVLLAPHRPLIQSHLMVDFLRFGYAPNFNRSGKLGG